MRVKKNRRRLPSTGGDFRGNMDTFELDLFAFAERHIEGDEFSPKISSEYALSEIKSILYFLQNLIASFQKAGSSATAAVGLLG